MNYSPQMTPIGRWPGAVLLLFALLGGGSSARAEAMSTEAPAKHILLLYAYGYGGRGVELFSDGFFKALGEAGFSATNVHAEYLDLQRNQDVPGYRRMLLEMLLKKHAQRRIDLIVTVQQPAIDFLLADGRDIAPQAPVISIQRRPLLAEENSARSIVGELNQFDIAGTLEQALQLFPQTRRVVFASGSSAADAKAIEDATQVAEAWRGQVEFEYTLGQTLDEILQRVGHLPPHSIVIFTQYNVDAKGRVALAYEAESMIVKAANAPVFGFYDYNLRNGGIGGSVFSVEASGARTGKLALDMLNHSGSAASGTLQTGTLQVNAPIPLYDWSQIQRWGGDIRRLPAHAVFVNRPPSVWQQYGTAIVATLLFILAQSVLIAALLINVRRRRRAEEDIRSLNADLEQRVALRTAELTAANQELDSFAYAVSHDLRAPLRAMSGFSQALLEDYAHRLDGEAKNFLQQIGIASRKMGDLIAGMLALSRSTRGELRRVPIDLSALASRILSELARHEPGRVLSIAIEPGLTLDGDASMIEAAMENLLCNAWKYTSKTPSPTIRVYSGVLEPNGKGERDICECGICIGDNGAGFDMAHAGQLFQPFRRLHRQEEFPGIGIGLATVQRIIHRHGGQIRAQAIPGGGATFCFSLPDNGGKQGELP